MKLRNKKTGEIEDLECITIFECSSKTLGIGESIDEFYTIAELNEKWEDYKPAEPLIKDKKKHKIIRACASLDSVEDVKVVKRSSDDTTTLIFGRTTLTLRGRQEYDSLQQCGTYTIDELCGDEE